MVFIGMTEKIDLEELLFLLPDILFTYSTNTEEKKVSMLHSLASLLNICIVALMYKLYCLYNCPPDCTSVLLKITLDCITASLENSNRPIFDDFNMPTIIM